MAEFRSIKDVFRDPLIIALSWRYRWRPLGSRRYCSFPLPKRRGSPRNKSAEYSVDARRHKARIDAVGLSSTAITDQHSSTGNRRN